MKTANTLLFLLLISSIYSQDDEQKASLDIGGALRYNYNLSSWKPSQVKRGGDLGYEVFRLTVDGTYDQWELHIDQRFYSQEFGGAFLKYGYITYHMNEVSSFNLGLIPAYFGSQQFNSHSWFFQLPFYLGFEDDYDMGLSYNIDLEKHSIDLAFYKNAETLSFSDNAPISDARYNYDFSGDNKEVNQVTARYNYKLEKYGVHKIGATAQYGGIWHIPSQEVGSHYGIGAHYDGNVKFWNVKVQALTYNNRAVGNPTEIEMTAYGAPYMTAAKASIYSIGIAYTFEIAKGPIKSVQVYNDYSYMDKAESEWEDTQMNVTGLLIAAQPLYVYIDMARGLNQPWLGPQWTNALTKGDSEIGWKYRFNINLGYYF